MKPRRKLQVFGLGALALLAAAAVTAAANGAAAQQHAAPAHADLARGEKLYQGCVACHGTDGGGETDGAVPRIAGQFAPVVIKELSDFRASRRWDLRMEQVVDHHRLPNAQALADVAGYIANLKPTVAAGTLGGEYLTRGASIYLSRCATCHGRAGSGNAETPVPKLTAQHARYLLRQMQEAAGGGRPNMSPSHVKLLDNLVYEDFQGVADYLARQSVAPADSAGRPQE